MEVIFKPYHQPVYVRSKQKVLKVAKKKLFCNCTVWQFKVPSWKLIKKSFTFNHEQDWTSNTSKWGMSSLPGIFHTHLQFIQFPKHIILSQVSSVTLKDQYSTEDYCSTDVLSVQMLEEWWIGKMHRELKVNYFKHMDEISCQTRMLR